MNFMSRLIVVCAMLMLGVSQARAIVNGQEPAPSDFRFDAVCGIGYTAGLGNGESPFCSGTLIAPDLVLTAAHCLPGTWLGVLPIGFDGGTGLGLSARFRRDANGQLNHLDIEIVEWLPGSVVDRRWHDGADAIIGRLATPVTHVEPIPVSFSIAPRLLLPNQPATTDIPLIVAGWGRVECWNTGALGKLHYAYTTGFTSESDFILFPGCDSGVGVPGPAQHDSGGAILHEDCAGNLKLVGVIITTSGGPSVPKIANVPGFPRFPKVRPASTLDVKHDGLLNHADYMFYMDTYLWNAGFQGLCADFDDNGVLNFQDRVAFVTAFLAAGGTYCRRDINLDGVHDSADMVAMAQALYVDQSIVADFNLDGVLTQADMDEFLAGFGYCN